MKKPRKSPMGIIKIALLIPIVLVTLGLTTGMTPQQKSIKGKVVFADTGEPATGASVVIRGTTMGTVVDAEGVFKLNVDGDPEIVISFIGYSTLTVKSSKVTKKPLKLESGVFKKDLGSVPVSGTKNNQDAISIRVTDDSGKQPVFVLDGKVIKGIENIDSENIEKIEVLKDPDSEIAKKYNAKDGLILITSKDANVMLTPKESKALIGDNVSHQKGEEVFYIVEDMPMFPGGKAALKTYIYSNLEYPSELKKKGTSGEVNVQFLVTTSGKLEDIKVASSTYEGFEKPAMDVFKGMPDWTPGTQRGKPVNVQVVVPVRFNAGEE